MALTARRQRDLHVALVRTRPQKIVTHEPVEVVRSGGAGVDLGADDLGEPRQRVRHLGQGPVRRLERRSLGKVDDDLELVLVVEGQHLDDHDAERHERHGRSEESPDGSKEEDPRPTTTLRHERRHSPPVKRAELAPPGLAVLELVRRNAPEETARRPRRDAKRDHQGERASPPRLPTGIGRM